MVAMAIILLIGIESVVLCYSGSGSWFWFLVLVLASPASPHFPFLGVADHIADDLGTHSPAVIATYPVVVSVAAMTFIITTIFITGIQMYMHLVKVLEDNYPEMMKMLFIVNGKLCIAFNYAHIRS